jgi:uncharacterized protein (TIGR03435 family)
MGRNGLLCRIGVSVLSVGRANAELRLEVVCPSDEAKRKIIAMPVRQFNMAKIVLILAFVSGSFALPILPCQANSPQGKPSQESKEDAPESLPQFEVATVRPTGSVNRMFFFGLMPDGIRIQNIPLEAILRAAFGMEDDRVLGSPSWTKSEHFDIEAKVGPSDVPNLGKLTIEQRRSMLLPLLIERFNLKFHYEKRDLPLYKLVIAKGVSKLKESNVEFSQRGLRIAGRGHLVSQGSTLKSLIPLLSRELGRTVLDDTGLTGRYDYDLIWLPDDGFPPVANGEPAGSNAQADATSVPNLFTALQEQLGLRLEPQKGPIDVVVIDEISKPSAN